MVERLRNIFAAALLIVPLVASAPIQQSCPVTSAVREEPPADPNADAFGDGPWFRNTNRTMWAWAGSSAWRARRDGIKILWIRPAGAQLVISGRRIDGGSPPLVASVVTGYPSTFQPTRLFFPAPGCWQITANA
jgi:hypothetical protein